MKKGLTVLFAIAVGIVGAIAVAYLLFAIAVFVGYAFSEGYREIEFPGVQINATAEMHPWLIESKKDIPTPLYISVNGKSLKLDSETTKEETKKYFEDIGLDCKERVDVLSTGEIYIYLSPGRLSLKYHHDKLMSYSISTDSNEKKRIDGVCIGTSPQALFPLPLRFADIEAMFGRNYQVRKQLYK